jgi:hypothetical protein
MQKKNHRVCAVVIGMIHLIRKVRVAKYAARVLPGKGGAGHQSRLTCTEGAAATMGYHRDQIEPVSWLAWYPSTIPDKVLGHEVH